ncbi:YopX family protein [Lactiplantibacillus argentoratensis]|uniref:YopX protein domain-containing protein n=2 Tax=Lactiplantibacillus argentoratensis TaxID=271881 RepID=A0AAN1Q1K9_9LACO|nr:YopX family protein [Lactiplantibacillus argentoratensis]AYJ36056.1 hypothetical protein LPA65_09935 [Lactiplantibacillus argentoratensis]AYJ36109.1 hypothetical protein LPA65_10250 [Lactiplantibacillus argentoratensis]AYJ36158.1 hypothetical protein LPA65_10565 [Lactiplantibacillus argentoratensis]GEO53962.1 hypothetical protein LPL03_20580 [Lactiplantibacillus argentoratensis]
MIKFRAWDNECKVIRDYDELKGLTLDALDASDFKLEQFTGLKDVNGNDIYEGDILEVTIDGTVQADKYLVKNVWDPHVWTEESDGYYAVSKMKVQGNVHANPELLEADK